MKIESYRDEPRCKTILKIEVDDDINDIEEAKKLIAEDVREKLRKYWKIEEELGIPLEVLFKALKEGVWVKGDKWIYNYKVLDFGLSIQEWAIYNDDFFRSTKDYGKTWALTREELE